jgi:hypothetical protein
VATIEHLLHRPASLTTAPSATATRVRHRLGTMLVLVVVAAGVAAAVLAALLVNEEAVLAVAAAAVVLGVVLVVALSIVVERRRLHDEAIDESTPRLAAVGGRSHVAPMQSVGTANGADLFDDPSVAPSKSSPKGKKRKRGGDDELLDEILNWPARGA